ncbi:MAG: alpha-glucosidase, partial [Pseudomonadota bacterium]
ALTKGEHGGVFAYGDVLQFTREHQGETLFCAFNLSDTPSLHGMPPGNWLTIGYELGGATPSPDFKLHLGPWQVCLAIKQD